MIFWHLSGSPVVDHLAIRAVNLDASPFVRDVGNSACAVHVLTGLSGFVGNGAPLLFVHQCGQFRNNQGSSSAGLGHSDCK
jgi:hypothetical protein